MDLTYQAHAAVARYRDQADQVSAAMHDLVTVLDDCRERLAAGGVLGHSADPHLERARAQLDVARAHLARGAQAAAAAPTPCANYVARVFPR